MSNTQRAIEIDSYEVTIFPAESVKNTHTLGALSRRGNENWLVIKFLNESGLLQKVGTNILGIKKQMKNFVITLGFMICMEEELNMLSQLRKLRL